MAAKDFRLRGGREISVREGRVALDAPIRLGRATIPAHADVRYTDRADGSSQLEAAARLSTTIERFNLAANVKYMRQYLAKGPAPPASVVADLIGTGRVGPVRIRGSTSFEISPQSRFRSAELSGYWSASDYSDWEGALAYDGPEKRARARLSYIRRFDSVAVAITGEAATDGSAAVGVNLNFSLDPGRGFTLSRERIAGAGSVRAKVYRDLNDNGVADPGEPVEKGALVVAGHAIARKPTDSKGSVMIAGLATYTPITVGIDQTSLADPMLTPKKAVQVVVPRPGVPADVEIGLVGAGDVEGAVVKSGGLGFEGLDLELVDRSGAVVATARSDYDGYFLFERVPYGTYSVRISSESAKAAQVARELNVSVNVVEGEAVVRLGTIHLNPPPRIAASQ